MLRGWLWLFDVYVLSYFKLNKIILQLNVVRELSIVFDFA